MRKLLRVAVGVAVAAALGGAGTAWATKPTGNAAAIAFARSVAKTYSHVPAVAFVRSGYVAMHSYLGKVSGFSWSWGTGVIPAGWVRVDESAVVALKAGRIDWFTEALIPQGCHGTVCPQPIVVVVVTSRGRYWRFDVPSAPACYRRLVGSTPLAVGQAIVSVGGHFGPLTRQGKSVLTHYTYAWDPAQTATETDAISARTRLVIATRVVVSKGSGRHQPRFTYQTIYSSLKGARQPRVKVC